MIRRHLLALLPLGLAACSVLPDRPYQESRRYALAPRRPGGAPSPPRGGAPSRGGGPVLLVRVMRAAPGLDQRGLRSVAADGRVTLGYWDEWAAPPPDATEEALRRWMTESGLFAAVTAPGSRLPADVILEGELVRLEARPAEGLARADLSVLLLSRAGGDGFGEPRVLGQMLVDGTAPLPGGAEAPPPAQAAAMEQALGAALAALEARMRPLLAAGRR
jgi:hypothetical protein